MKKIYSVIIYIFLMLTLVSCKAMRNEESVVTKHTIIASDKQNIIIRDQSNNKDLINPLEARYWLKNNVNKHAFAGNRFENTKAASEFAEQLYNAGAENIQVSGVLNEDMRIEKEGGPYADTFIVRLPEDKEKRQKILSIYFKEAENQDFIEDIESLHTIDFGQKDLFFWWN